VPNDALITNGQGATDQDGNALLNSAVDSGVNPGCDCCTDTPQPVECCKTYVDCNELPDAYPGGSNPGRECGAVSATHQFRMRGRTFFRESIQRSQFSDYCGPDLDPANTYDALRVREFREMWEQEGEAFLTTNNFTCCPPFCAPYREVREGYTTTTYTGCVSRTDRTGSREEFTYLDTIYPGDFSRPCDQIFSAWVGRSYCCWPLDGNLQDGWFWAREPGSTTRLVPRADGTFLRIEESTTRNYAVSAQTMRDAYEYRRTETVVPGDFVIREETERGTIEFEHGWSHNCDGSPANELTPGPNVTNCDDYPLIRYRLGEPCGGLGSGAPPFALPKDNVRGCGLVRNGGYCYIFEAIGQDVVQLPPGTTVGTTVIDQFYPIKLCCDCLEQCESEALVPLPQWLNGQRDGFTGAWSTSPAFAAGNCCCRDDDIFKIERATLRHDLTFFSNGDPELWQEHELIYPPNPVIDPLTSGPYPSPLSPFGVRRDAAAFQIGYRYRTCFKTSPTSDVVCEQWITSQRGVQNGTIGCEWRITDTGTGGVGNEIGFELPLHVNGWPTRDQISVVPVPYAVPETGDNGIWKILRYVLGATCTTLSADGLWERQLSDGTPVERIAAMIRWRMSQSPNQNDECTGGCQPPGILFGTTDPASVPHVAGPDEYLVRRAAGGCGSCGQSGGL
jgi:hypothetical protein